MSTGENRGNRKYWRDFRQTQRGCADSTLRRARFQRIGKFLEELDLARGFDGDFFHRADAFDGSGGGITFGDQVSCQHGAGASDPGFAMNRDGMSLGTLLVDEGNKVPGLGRGRGPTVGNGKTGVGKPGPFVECLIAGNIEQANDGPNAAFVHRGQLVIVGAQDAAAIEPAFGMDVGHRHAGQDVRDDPPEQTSGIRHFFVLILNPQLLLIPFRQRLRLIQRR